MISHVRRTGFWITVAMLATLAGPATSSWSTADTVPGTQIAQNDRTQAPEAGSATADESSPAAEPAADSAASDAAPNEKPKEPEEQPSVADDSKLPDKQESADEAPAEEQATPATEGNRGQADLDAATEAKLAATTLSDLGEVIRLCQGALDKGLTEENRRFAEQLLASTLFQRGTYVAKTIFEDDSPDPRWPQFRRLALEDLRRAVELDPNQPQAHYLIARLNLLPGGDMKEAEKALNLTIKQTDEDKSLKAKALFMRAALQDDDQKQLADLDEAARLAPDDASVLRNRGLAYAEMKKLDKALADFQAALKIEPEHVPTYEALIVVLAGLERYDEALVAADKLREIEPASVAPLNLRARVHAMQGNHQAALHDMEEAMRMDSNNASLYLARADIYREMKQYDNALADVDRAMALKPDLDPARQLRTMLLIEADRQNEALGELQQAIEEEPDNVELRQQLAVLYNTLERPRKSIEVYEEILAKDPENVFALRGRGDAMLAIGEHEKAIGSYEKALKLRPEDPGTLNNLAWVLATTPKDKLRDAKRATELATKACELTDYDQAHILSTLAAAYAEAGDFQTARKWAEQAVEKGGEDQKEQLQAELESYRSEKPWRELLTAPDEPEEAASDKKPREAEQSADQGKPSDQKNP